MRTLIFLVILGFAYAVPQYGKNDDSMIQVRGLIEDGINKTVNDLLAKLTEPIAVDLIALDAGDNDILKGGLNVSSLKINGIKSLVATEIKLNILSLALEMHLHVHEILANFKYWADLELLDLVPLYGEGRMNIVLEHLDLTIVGAANLTGSLSISNLTLGIALGDATFDLNGLINNPEFSALVSTALNDNFVTFLNKNAEVISSIVSPIAEILINSILKPAGDNEELQQLLNQYRSINLIQ